MASNMGRGLWAVVPVKLFARTKRRLAPLLSPPERAALACAMLEDVLSALAQAPCLTGILVVTGDPQAAAMAHAAGALVISDTENAGTTAAVATAAAYLVDCGHDGMLVVPADVPSITVGDIETIVAAHRDTPGGAPALTLVPATMDGGTNALACSPADAIPLCFGDESFARHCEAARARGLAPQIVRLSRVGQDIDRPEDVAEFLLDPSPTHTYAYLTTLPIAERIQVARLSLRAREGVAIPEIPAPFVRHGIASSRRSSP